MLDTAKRMQQLMAGLPGDMDAVLVTSGVNRRYFTGLRSSAGVLFITREQAYFIIDFRYIEVARKTVQGAQVILQEKLGEQLKQLAARHNVKRVGMESGYMKVEEFMDYSEMLKGQAELLFDRRASQLILQLRRIKSAQEFALIQQAQDITDKTFAHILGYIKEGRTEREISMEMTRFMGLNGSEANAFSNIVVSGVNSSMPHGVPTDKPVQAGDFITMDFGAVVDGYCSDMTRTVAVGHVTDEQRQVYDTVLRAQKACLDYIKPGVTGFSVDKVARDLIYGAGYEGCFGHGLGHSFGLEVHEGPRCNQVDHSPLLPGVTSSVEPGIYLEGRFGVRIEDIVGITEDGYINFTHSPKELIIL